jgi:hypothetical protein
MPVAAAITGFHPRRGGFGTLALGVVSLFVIAAYATHPDEQMPKQVNSGAWAAAVPRRARIPKLAADECLLAMRFWR